MIRSAAALTLVLGLWAGAAGAAPPAKPVVRPLWDYVKELGLSAQQVKTIQAAAIFMRDRAPALQKQQVAQNRAVNELIRTDADSGAIRAKARQLLETELEVRMLDIETAQKMKRALTPGQLAKWRAIQTQQRAIALKGQARTR